VTNGFIFIVVGAFATFLLRRRVIWPVTGVVLAHVAFPNQVVGAMTQWFTPAQWMLLGQVAIFAWLFNAQLVTMIRRHGLLLASLGALGCWMALDVFNVGNSTGGVFTDVLRLAVLPAIQLLIVAVTLRLSSRNERFLVAALIVMACVQVFLAERQVSTHGDWGYFWRTYYERSTWWSSGWDLGMGTTGYPLQLGLFLALTTPFVAWVKSSVLRFGLLAAFVYGTGLSTGRTAFVLTAVAAFFVLVQGSRRWVASLVTLGALAALAPTFLASRSFEFISNKFNNDAGSAEMRRSAFAWAWERRGDYFWFGYPGTRDLRNSGYVSSSLENGYLMFGFSFGLIAAVALVLVQVAAIAKPALASAQAWPAALSALIIVIGGFGSSSFMAFGLEGMLLWVIIPMATFAADRAVGRWHPPDHDAEDESTDDESQPQLEASPAGATAPGADRP
jgi:hypothetical protein